MNLVTLDWETFYSPTFSLTKLTTEEYVRSNEFEAIGLSIKVNDRTSEWFPKPDIERGLALVDWSDAMVLAQNTAFDGAIMSWRYDIRPKAWADTLGMSRALFPHEKSHSLKAQAIRMGVGEKGTEVENALGKRYKDFTPEQLARYGEYCCNDADLTYQIFMMYMEMGFPKKELQLIDTTLRMFTEPSFVLNGEKLKDHLALVKERKLALLENVRDNALSSCNDPQLVREVFANGTESLKTLLMSNDRFAEALVGLGVAPPTKVSARTGKVAYAFAKTDEEFQALRDHENPEVQALVEARLGNKTTIEETRTQRFIDMSTRGAFPVPLRYYGAHSGRWSGQDKINLQNLPSRGPDAKQIKKTIMAPPGHVVIDCDSSQIEARCLAWLAGQEDFLDAFRREEDVYKLMASQIYSVGIADVDKQQRQVGKTVVLGAGYGVGHVKMQMFLKTQAGVEVTLEEAKRIIDAYRTSAHHITDLWSSSSMGLKHLVSGQPYTIDVPGIIRVDPGKGLTLPNGLHIQYPELRVRTDAESGKAEMVYTSKGLPVRIYGGKCVENYTQAVARCVVAEQMLRIGKRYQPKLTVHDAVAIVVPEGEADDAVAFVEDCMRWVPKWATGLPLACESGMGESYGAC